MEVDLYKLHATLSAPFWWSTKVVSRSFSAIQPGNYGQCSSKMRELLYRIVPLTIIILISPFAIILKGVAELCCLGQLTSFADKKNEDIHEPQKKLTALSLLTWNICGLPGGLPNWFGGVPSIADRIDRIATFIIESQCDIVCLQEAHDIEAARALCRSLKTTYSYIYPHIGSKPFCFDSGLFIASKKKLSDISFTPFTFKGIQGAINKGFCCFSVTSENNPAIKIVATHLQPFHTEKDRQLRALEWKEIAKNNPVIVCGDLNIDRYKEEEKEMIENMRADYIDAFEDAFTGDGLITATDDLLEDRNGQAPTSSQESIDYCLLKRNSLYSIQTTRKEAYDLNEPEKALSDHHALISTISLA